MSGCPAPWSASSTTQNTFGLSVAPIALSRLARAGYVESSPVAPPEARRRRRSPRYSSTIEVSLAAFAGLTILYRNEDSR